MTTYEPHILTENGILIKINEEEDFIETPKRELLRSTRLCERNARFSPYKIKQANEEDIIRLMSYKKKIIETLHRNISSLSNVNSFTSWHFTNYNLLFHASRLHCEEVIDVLLDRGADPTLINNDGTSVLHLMAKKGQVEMAEKCFLKVSLAKRMSFLNARTNTGLTPLIAAVENNQLSFVKWLLSKRAEINFEITIGNRKSNWRTMDAKKNNEEIFKILLECLKIGLECNDK